MRSRCFVSIDRSIRVIADARPFGALRVDDRIRISLEQLAANDEHHVFLVALRSCARLSCSPSFDVGSQV